VGLVCFIDFLAFWDNSHNTDLDNFQFSALFHSTYHHLTNQTSNFSLFTLFFNGMAPQC
jgi:hypothetical protein